MADGEPDNEGLCADGPQCRAHHQSEGPGGAERLPDALEDEVDFRESADGEATTQALSKAARSQRMKDNPGIKTYLAEASLRDSANNGAVEATVRWWQQRVGTYRYTWKTAQWGAPKTVQASAAAILKQ